MHMEILTKILIPTQYHNCRLSHFIFYFHTHKMKIFRKPDQILNFAAWSPKNRQGQNKVHFQHLCNLNIAVHPEMSQTKKFFIES